MLADKLGPRTTLKLFRLLTGVGAFIFVSSSISDTMLGKTLIGLGVSVAFLSSAKLIASRLNVGSPASVTGLLVSVGNLGGLVASAPPALMVSMFGWRCQIILVRSLPEWLQSPPINTDPWGALTFMLRGISDAAPNSPNDLSDPDL